MLDWIRKLFSRNELPVVRYRTPPPAANDDCFWHAIWGRDNPFQTASFARRRLTEIREEMKEFYYEGDARLIDQFQLTLDLFNALHVQQSIEAAEKLAPRFNEYIPDIMARCPNKSLRPD